MLQFLWNPVIVFSVSVLFGRWDGGWLVPQATPHREASLGSNLDSTSNLGQVTE